MSAKQDYPVGNPLSGRVTVTHVPKPWGYEIIWANTDSYVGKILHVNAGQALSVQYHNTKDETVHLLSGEMIYWVKLPGSEDRKSTRLNSSHGYISYAVFCLK